MNEPAFAFLSKIAKKHQQLQKPVAKVLSKVRECTKRSAAKDKNVNLLIFLNKNLQIFYLHRNTVKRAPQGIVSWRICDH